MDLDYIDNIVDTEKYYLYYKNKPILFSSNMKNLKAEIKKNVNEPKDDTKVYVVNFGKSDNKNKLFIVHCFRFTITKKLALVARDDDTGQIITYSKKQLEERKFKLSDILKIIKAIESDNVSFEKQSIPITKIL